ncbi:MAG: hypothetical protein E6R05_01910 [Candidatus Moraniibacteriota bacterium]|nr:MAG: hypothetical protein E6R05_01910 [Candidatus Moranbacteria bacterium]
MTVPANLNVLKNHRYADIFPMMDDVDFQRLIEDVKLNGLQEPIWLYQGQILDGRNRFKACVEAGIESEFREYQGTKPLEFVLSLNLSRRHLNSSQCAFIALEVERVLAEEAKERQVEAGKQRADSERNEVGTFVQLKEKIPEAGQEKPEPQAREKAASIVGNTNARYVQDAKKIEREAPEVKALVMSGKVHMGDAVKLSRLSTEKRKAVISKIEANPESTAAALKTIRGTLGTGENEWYTPQEYIDHARHVMGGITLDPASCDAAQALVGADRFFSEEENGLHQEWVGNVWLNPPYSQPLITQFIEKLCAEFESGRCKQAILLTHNYTDTKWFQLAAKAASHICFTKGRIKFYSPSGAVAAPTQGQAFFYFGKNGARFASVFSDVGIIAKVVNEVQ